MKLWRSRPFLILVISFLSSNAVSPLSSWAGLIPREKRISVDPAVAASDSCSNFLAPPEPLKPPGTRAFEPDESPTTRSVLQPRGAFPLSSAKALPSFSTEAAPFGYSLVYDAATGQLEPAADRLEGTRATRGFDLPSPRTRGFDAVRGGFEESVFDPAFAERAHAFGLELAEAGPADAAELSRFIQRSRGEFAESPAELDEDLADIQRSYFSNDGHFFVMRDRATRKIVGSGAIYNLGDGQAEVRKLYLDPALRGRSSGGLSLGRLAFQHLLRWAKQRGYRVVELETYANMKAARKLYESFGFTRFFPRRIQKENAANPDPERHVVGYALFLHPRVPVGEQTETQKKYYEDYRNHFSQEFAEKLRNDPKFSESVYHPILGPILRGEVEEDDRRPEYAIYEMLGVFEKDGKIRLPSHHELGERVIGLFSDLDLKRKLWILHALTFKRDLGGGRVQYLFITPGIHPFPTEEGFTLVDRVPDPVFKEMVVNGLLPLSTLHDMHHFISLIQHAHYMRELSKARQAYKDAGKFPDFLHERRLNYALESLALASPSKAKDLVSALKVPKLDPRGFGDFMAYFEKAGEAEMIDHALALSKNYRKYLDFYSGAGISPIERALEENELLEKLKDRAALKEYIDQLNGLPQYAHGISLPRESFDEDPTFWPTRLSLMLAYRGMLAEDAAETARIDAILRKQLARMEYFLWASAHEFTLSRWIGDLVPEESRTQERTLRFIRDSFGENSVTYRMLRGIP